MMRTNVAEFASSPLAINLSRIAAICEEEWQSFLDDVNIHPIPRAAGPAGILLELGCGIRAGGIPLFSYGSHGSLDGGAPSQR